MSRFILILLAALFAGVGASALAESSKSAPVYGTYNPFAMMRASSAPGTPENAKLRRRLAIVNRVKNRVSPPKRQPVLSPAVPDKDKGHGNDPDRHDEDNPGNSTGPKDKDKDKPGNGNPGNGNPGNGNPGNGNQNGNGNANSSGKAAARAAATRR